MTLIITVEAITVDVSIPVLWRSFALRRNGRKAGDDMQQDDKTSSEIEPAGAVETMTLDQAADALNVPIRMIGTFIAEGKLRIAEAGVRETDVHSLVETHSRQLSAALDMLEEWSAEHDFDQ